MQKSNIISEAFQCIPELVFVVSENGRYHALGGITEHHPEDIVGKTIDELFPVDVQPFLLYPARSFFKESRQCDHSGISTKA